VRYTKKGAIVPGSLVVGKSHPKDGVWKEVTIDLCCAEPVPPVIESSVTPNIDMGTYGSFFDLYQIASVGWWMKVASDTNFPRIFSFGQYPTAEQAVSIENNILYVWHNGSVALTYSLTSYINQWVWVSIIGGNLGNIVLYINGVSVANATLSSPISMTLPLVIGTENVSGTYYNGLLRDFVFDVANTMALENVPTSPLMPFPNTILLLFQGTTLSQQLTDNGIFNFPVTGNNVSYNADSPYLGFPGSTQFGTI
jgi:hypothetical protein